MLCILLGLLIFGTMIWGCVHGKYMIKDTYSDGIEQIDIDSIYLDRSDVQVDFSEVLIGKQEETRKLIVSTQEATVSTELTERLIKKLDYKALKKTQKVTYTGKGYFVVDLDQLTKGRIIEDKKNKTLTIKIDHAYLQAIEIERIGESIALLKDGAVPYEFRTTVVAELHDEESFRGIGKWIAGAQRYYLQKFTDRDTVPFEGFHAPADGEMRRYREIVEPFVGHAELRGVE